MTTWLSWRAEAAACAATSSPTARSRPPTSVWCGGERGRLPLLRATPGARRESARAGDFSRRARRRIAPAARQRWAKAERSRDTRRRRRPRRGPEGGPRDPAGEISRSAARNPLWRERPSRDEEDANDLGSSALPGTAVLVRRNGDPKPRGRRRGPDGEARDGRARGRHGLQQRRRVVHRTGIEPVEHRVLERRLL